MGLLKHQFYYKEAGVVAGTYTYTAYPDMPEPGIGGIQTTGSTTTIDAATAAQAPFAPLAVGDLLYIRGPGLTPALTKLVTKTSNIQIVVADAQNIATPTGAWGWYKKLSGTTATARGYHNFNNWANKTFVLKINTLNSTSIDVQIEGLGSGEFGTAWTVIYTQNYTATGTFTFNIPEEFALISVGHKCTGAGTNDFDVFIEGQEKTT